MKMNNNLSASDYRSRARESLKGKYWPAVGVTLLASLIMGGVGGASFSFYIWHQWLAVRLKMWRIPPYQAAADPNQAGEMPWQLHYTLACFFAALALAILVTYLIEKPAAKYGRRLIDQLKA